MKTKSIVKIYALWVAIVTMSLLVAPLFAQTLTQNKQYVSEKAMNIIEITSSDKEWGRTDTNIVRFNPDNLLETSDFGIAFGLEYEVHAQSGRTTVCLYEVYLNGKYVETIRHTIDGFRNLKGYSTYDPVLLPFESLEIGDNEVEVKMSFDSTSVHQDESMSYTYKLTVRDMKVVELPRDTDGDGIKDAMDPFKGNNNIYVSLIASLAAFPPITGLTLLKKDV